MNCSRLDRLVIIGNNFPEGRSGALQACSLFHLSAHAAFEMFLTRDASFDETLRFQRPDSLGPKIFSYFLLTPGGKPLLLSDPFYFQFVNDRKIPIRWRQAGRGKTRNSPFCSQLFQTSEGIFCLSRFQTESKRKISQTSVYRYSGPVFDMQRFFNRLDCREKGNFEPRACPRVEKLIVEQQERIWKMALNNFLLRLLSFIQQRCSNPALS